MCGGIARRRRRSVEVRQTRQSSSVTLSHGGASIEVVRSGISILPSDTVDIDLGIFIDHGENHRGKSIVKFRLEATLLASRRVSCRVAKISTNSTQLSSDISSTFTSDLKSADAIRVLGVSTYDAPTRAGSLPGGTLL